MIVPQNRLLHWVGLVALPFAIAAAVEPASVPVVLLLTGTLGALVLMDALLALGRLDGLVIQLPEIVRLSKDRAGLIEVRFRNEKRETRTLRVGLPLPREVSSSVSDQTVQLPPGSEWSRLEWPCQPGRRGRYLLQQACLESASPFGFWAVRASLPIRSELRVYPNLLTERKSVATLFLNRGRLGIHARRIAGKGRDFEKLRDYVPGDNYDEIHWKATAKRGHPVTKVFQVERTQEVYVIIDSSRLTARRSALPDEPEQPQSPGDSPAPPRSEPHVTVLERYITAALMLGIAAEQQGDLYGLMTYSDRVGRFVRARNGKAHYASCRDALYALQPEVVTPDFDDVCAFIRLRLRRRALLVFLTSLDDPLLAEAFVRNIDLICRQHLVLVNMMRPAGARPLFSDGNVQSVDDLYRHLGGHARWHGLRELEKVLQRRGVQLTLVDNEKLSAQLVTQYLDVKQRQRL